MAYPDSFNMDDHALGEVTSTKTSGDYTLTLYATGTVRITLTATGAGVRPQTYLQAIYPSLP
jgi:hypothetical protein